MRPSWPACAPKSKPSPASWHRCKHARPAGVALPEPGCGGACRYHRLRAIGQVGGCRRRDQGHHQPGHGCVRRPRRRRCGAFKRRGRGPDFAERAVREGANLQASEALKANVVNYVATDLPDLLRQADGARVHLSTGDITLRTAGVGTRRADMSAIESFMLTITNPTIAYILLSIGSLGLLLELYTQRAVF